MVLVAVRSSSDIVIVVVVIVVVVVVIVIGASTLLSLKVATLKVALLKSSPQDDSKNFSLRVPLLKSTSPSK